MTKQQLVTQGLLTDVRDTENYERSQLLGEIDRLRNKLNEVESAVHNLMRVSGRYHTQYAYEALEAVMK